MEKLGKNLTAACEAQSTYARNFQRLEESTKLLLEASRAMNDTMNLALNRLRTPVQLSEKAREQYLDYLGGQMQHLLERTIKEQDLETLELLCEQELLSEENMSQAAKLAAGQGAAELGSYLLEEKRKRFRPVKKTFDL